MITSSQEAGVRHAIASSKLVRRLAAVRRADACPDRAVHLDRQHAAVRVEGVRMVVRFTARTSLMFFCLAFSAAALARLWPNGWTRWQRRNRRYLGVTFAASHGLHAIAIVRFAEMAPADFAAATSAASYIFGGIGYAFIILMTATSFDRTASMVG